MVSDVARLNVFAMSVFGKNISTGTWKGTNAFAQPLYSGMYRNNSAMPFSVFNSISP